MLGVSFCLALSITHPARAFQIFSDKVIADTFDSRSAVRVGDEDAATRSAERAIAQKVRAAVRRYQRQPGACGTGDRCDMATWHAFLDSVRDASPIAKLDAVNRWVNRFPYVSDWQNWGVADYWETPAELMARGGQCEDYAMVKYLALRALGFDIAAMRIVAVRDGADDHAVLVVRIGGRLYMLDNLERNVVDGARAPGYRLVYAVNERIFWRYANTEIPIPGSPVAPARPDSEPALLTAAADPSPVFAPPIPGVRPITTAEIAREPVVAVAATAPVAPIVPAFQADPAAQLAFAPAPLEPSQPPSSDDPESATPY
jgi:predicted transglutaminase-like cysteine proteinase